METIRIIERWFNQDGTIYREWSFDGGQTWKSEKTYLPEVPVIKIPFGLLKGLMPVGGYGCLAMSPMI